MLEGSRLFVFLFVLSAVVLLLAGCTVPWQHQPAGQANNHTVQSPLQPSTQPPAASSSEPAAQQPSQEASQTQNQTQSNHTQPPATSLKSEEVSYNSGAWKVYATLYPSQSKTPTKAIILVPQLGKTRESYPVSFIESLHNHFPEAVVLAIDPRGHGKSTNLGNWQSFDTAAYKDMKTDILAARKNLFEPRYPNVEEYYVVGASIGSTSAINAAAQEKRITKVVMLSPGMMYKNVDITDSVEDYRHALLLVASSGDSYSVQAVNEIKTLSSGPETEIKIYAGSAHGTDLFDATKDSDDSLSAKIVEFLK